MTINEDIAEHSAPFDSFEKMLAEPSPGMEIATAGQTRPGRTQYR